MISPYLHLAEHIILILAACVAAACALLRSSARAVYACWAVGLIWLAASRI